MKIFLLVIIIKNMSSIDVKQGIKRKGSYINLTEKLDRVDYCSGTVIKTITEHMKEQGIEKHMLFGSDQILYGCSNLGCTICSCIHFRRSIYKCNQ